MTNRQFCHLHVHTEYSMLDGAAKIEALFAEAARLGQPAVAMTDHGNLYGAYRFHQVAQRVGVKPIIGIEAYLAPGDRTLREPVRWGTPEQTRIDVGGGGAHTHLTLLALDATGLRNLFRLSSLASMEGFYRKPRVDRELLAQHSEGILATTGCLGGEISTRLRLGQHDAAIQAAAEMRDIFGPDYYLEVMDHGIAEERALRPALMRLRDQLRLPALATNDSHYVTPGQASAHDALLCVQTHAKLADTDRLRFDGEGYHLKSAAEMRAYWDRELSGACDATLQVAQRVGDYGEVFVHADRMPRFEVPDGHTSDSWLAAEVERGLARRYPDGVSGEHRARADYELGVIAGAGFPGYFLVVADLVAHAHKLGIRVGPGRGSGAGSLVAYALGITNLDPITHGLLFERFLNPERVSPPDIDIDFDDRRRDELVRYLTGKWGAGNVAHISTFGRIRAKAAIKDATRVLGLPYSLGEKLSNAHIEPISGFGAPLAAVTDPEHPRYSESAELRNMTAADEDARAVLKTAQGLEDLVRSAGVHASGLILSAQPLVDAVPVRVADGALVTGFDMVECEAMGLLKIDMLGLRNLGVLDDTVTGIRDQRGIEIDLDALPLDDQTTYSLLARGDTLGCFQLDSDGLRGLLRRMTPTRFADLSAAIALYRPGPMGMNAHHDYADRKNRRKPVRPIHPELADALAPILGETHHLIVYQEQVMQIGRQLAGYTLGQADLLRKAMGKKKPEVLAKEQPAFLAGMGARGFSSEAARALWDTLLPFAAYAFNKSHSAAYALIGYWTAYLKTHYPVEYMAALLSSVAENKDRMALYLSECRSMGLRVLPPDVGSSGHHFSPTPEGIRFGLDAVRNVGAGVVDAILAAREDGPFADVPDFLLRAGIGKRALEGLIQAGALDTLGATRRGVWDARDVALGAAGAVRKQRDLGQFDLFGDDIPDDAPAAGLAVPFGADEWPRDELLARERDVLGLYVSSHPLSGVAHVLAEHRDAPITELTAEQADTPGDDDRERTVRVSGLLTGMEPKTNREGKRWALLTVEDLTGVIEVCVFPRQYGRLADRLFLDEIIIVTGRLNRRDDQISLIAQDAETVTALPAAGVAPVLLDVPGTPGQREIDRLAAVLAAHPGAHPVRLRTGCGAVLELTGHAVTPSTGLHREAMAALRS